MRGKFNMLLGLLAAACMVAAKGEPPIAAPTPTNASPPLLPQKGIASSAFIVGPIRVATNVVNRADGKRTNVTVNLVLPDGTRTNIVFQHDPKHLEKLYPAIARALAEHARSGPTPRLGDFWLPGEFEKLRKEREEQRRGKAK